MQERGKSVSYYWIHVEGVFNDNKMKFPNQVTEIKLDQLLISRCYSGLCSQILDGMRDMFRNSAYNVTALMKTTWDLKEVNVLDRGKQQVTAKVTSVGDQGK